MIEARDELSRVYEQQAARLWRSLVGYTGDPEMTATPCRKRSRRRWHVAMRSMTRKHGSGDRLFASPGESYQSSRRRSPTTTEGIYEFPEPVDHLVAALLTISPNQRLAIVLHDYADRPTDEVAAVLGASRATVYVHLSEGRRRLRKALEAPDE